jgi:hypothetical protein
VALDYAHVAASSQSGLPDHAAFSDVHLCDPQTRADVAPPVRVTHHSGATREECAFNSVPYGNYLVMVCPRDGAEAELGYCYQYCTLDSSVCPVTCGTCLDLVSIAVTPASATVNVGSTLQLTVSGTLSDGTTQPVDVLCHWESSDPSVATVDHGLVRGVSPGPATIKAHL